MKRAPALKHPWLPIAAIVLLAATLFVVLSGMRPGYDAYGWLVWGRQALHGNLNTDGAPSWKPLTFVFTFPYALAGRAQVWLWMVTAVAGALAGAVFAARIAYKLSGPRPERRYAATVAAVFAGLGVLGIDGASHQVLIANADPMIVALCLAAIDCHLSHRRRLALTMLVLAALGRPEAWPFAGLYALWAWRAVPSMRLMAVIGVVLIPALWFSIPALTSKSWFSAGDLALNAPTVIHGSKLSGVLGRFGGLYDLPMRLAALFALGLAVVRRDRVWLALAGAALIWVVIEIAMAYHGWSAAPRYLMEPAAVMVALVGGAVGRVLAGGAAGRSPTGTPRPTRMLRWAGSAAVLVLLVALAPTVRDREQVARAQIVRSRGFTRQIKRLEAVIAKDGGAEPILACGQPVTFVGNASMLAWELGLNVGDVGYKPGRSIGSGAPIVYFEPDELGWQVRPIHMLAADQTTCARLKTDTPSG